MKALVSIVTFACMILFAGGYSANASPTFAPICFDQEVLAESMQRAHAYKQIDYSQQNKKEELILSLINRGDVKLSEVEAILGDSIMFKNNATNRDTHEWKIYYRGSPSSGNVYYDDQRGYCVDVRYGGTGIVSFRWTSAGFDSEYGRLRRVESFY